MNSELQHISHSYRTDAYQFLDKAETAYKHSSIRDRSGFQAKIVIDLYMSIECGLKSLACSCDPEQDAEVALKEIRKCSHGLSKLIELSFPEKLEDSDIDILLELNSKGVGIRYTLDVFAAVTSELFEGDDVTFEINDIYVNRIARIAHSVYKEATNIHKAAFPDRSRLLTNSERKEEVGKLRSLPARARSRRRN